MALGPQILSSDCMGTSVLFARGMSLGILEVSSPPVQQSLSTPAPPLSTMPSSSIDEPTIAKPTHQVTQHLRYIGSSQ